MSTGLFRDVRGVIAATTFVMGVMAVAGCHKATQDDAHASVQSTIMPNHHVEAMQNLEHKEGHSESPAEEASIDDPPAEQEQADVAEEIARERHELRRVLMREIRWIDKHLVSLKGQANVARGALRDERLRDMDTARAWQTRLKQDLEAVDRVSDKVWPALKNQIDRDIEQEHPLSIPRSYDKAYAI
ncbi:MAG: hypothetical protein FWD73_10615 [Polyangiaceae bacterium]|nr:hypothetical protein [Polyangiaceae bacterium]